MSELDMVGPTILVPRKNVILDATFLSTIMACPRLADLKLNRQFVSIKGKSRSLEMGLIVHKVMEVYYKCLINHIKRVDAIQFGLTAGLEYSESEEVRNTSDEEKKWALTTCEQYFDYYKNDFWTPLEVECVKGEVLYEDDEIRILYKAKYDLIMDTNQGIFPVDHKTMAQRRDNTNLNNQFMGQCILLKTRKMFVNKIGFQTSLEPKDKFTRAPINYSADRLSEFMNVTLPYYAKLMLMYQDHEHWPPNYTHCENKYGFCSFREVCEADRGMREETIQQNFEVGKKWDILNEEEG